MNTTNIYIIQLILLHIKEEYDRPYKDIDEKDLLATTKINLDKNTVVIPYLPLVKDIDELIKVVKSTPILEVSKGKQSAYSGEKL